MTPYRFEEYLEERCLEERPGTLDDDIENVFDAWLSGLDIETIIDYADLFALNLASRHVHDLAERLMKETSQKEAA